MADKKPSKLDEVNATLDRFARLIEENAQQSRRDKLEYDRKLAADKAEYDRKLAADKDEYDRKLAAWEKGMKDLRDQVGGQANSIGEITEAMTVSDNIVDLVNKFDGIDVSHFSFNITKKYPALNAKGKKIRKQHEVDGFASGDRVVIVVEAKTTLNEDDVKYFIEQRLAKFKLAYPEHANKTLYGAVTFIRTDNRAFALAEQQGLFIIKASPPDVELVNSKGFKPTEVVASQWSS